MYIIPHSLQLCGHSDFDHILTSSDVVRTNGQPVGQYTLRESQMYIDEVAYSYLHVKGY